VPDGRAKADLTQFSGFSVTFSALTLHGSASGCAVAGELPLCWAMRNPTLSGLIGKLAPYFPVIGHRQRVAKRCLFEWAERLILHRCGKVCSQKPNLFAYCYMP
jgi:hypothetical protein